MTGSSTMYVVSKRGNHLLRDFYSTHWNVALELLLRTVCLLVKDGQYPISSLKEPALFVLEKRWYREQTPFVLFRRVEFFYLL